MRSRSFISRHKRSLIIAAVAIGLSLCGYVTGHGLWRRWLMAQELQRIQAAGEPTTPEELAALYRVPTGAPNATAAWQAPLRALEQRAIGRYPYNIPLLDKGELPPPPGEAWPEREQANAFLAKHAGLLQKIDAAIAAPGECYYIDNFGYGYQTLLRHVQWMRELTRLLELRAYVHAHAGDGAGAIADVQATLRAAETLAREPVMVTQIARIARNKEGLAALDSLLGHVQASDEQWAALQHTLGKIDYRPALELVVLGERVNGMTAFGDASTAGAGNMPDALYQVFIRDEPLAYLRVMRELLEAVRTDWPGPLELTGKYSTGSIDKLSVAAPWGGGSWAAPSGIVGPLRQLVEWAARETARNRAATAGIAAIRFRQGQGRWPESLEELTPKWLAAVPLDPFTGKSLRLQQDESGVRIYSTGLDGRDDGGVEIPQTDNKDSPLRGQPDVVFTVRAE